MDHILITGGAGFIGSHLTRQLLESGYRVRILDNLSPQVHGPARKRPSYLSSEAELIVGDVTDIDTVRRSLRGIDAVVHFAALVGVGQSMYDLRRYTHVNSFGTSVLLEALIEHPVAKLLVASSMSIYGEGLYQSPGGSVRTTTTTERTLEQLRAGDWELHDPETGGVLRPVPTPEWKAPSLASLYALSKYDQEQMCLMVGRAYNIPAVAMRFFNVYGSNQSLSNPYTGVLAIFASRLLNDQPPVVFEDGKQKRDLVSVEDVALACRLALETEAASGQVFNVGSGRQYTIREVAEKVAHVLGKRMMPEISGEYRSGDIRHCFPDVGLARRILGFQAEVQLEDGLLDLAAWLETQTAVDHFLEARQQLAARGLVV